MIPPPPPNAEKRNGKNKERRNGRLAGRVGLFIDRLVGGRRSCGPVREMRPMSSLRPMLSKSMTRTSREHSRIFSHGTLKVNVSLKTGSRLHL